MMRGRSRSTLVLALACLGALSGWTAAYADGYRLGPRDKVRIKVYDWRPAASDTHEWTALTGEFMVAASGTLSLPLVGEISASGVTPSDIAATIAERLQAKIGLARRPDASVEVSEYRPFYILGQVGNPGEYPFRPDLTVLQAVSMAGGASRLADQASSFERDSLVSRGELRALGAERTSLLARQARLDAEMHDSKTLELPKELDGRQGAGAAAAQVQQEQHLLESRNESLRAQSEALDQTATLLASEVETLKAKSAALDRQRALAKQELDSISGLVAKGLSVTARQLSLEQNVAQFESARLDVELLIIRAREDISRIARDKADLRNRRRNEVLTDLSEVRTKLATNAEKMRTAQSLAVDAETRAPEAFARTDPRNQRVVYTVTRRVDGRLVSNDVGEDDPVEPGDTIRVRRQEPGPGESTVAEGAGSPAAAATR